MNSNLVRFLLLALFWGGSFVAIEEVLHAYPPMFAAFLRMFIAAFFMGVWAWLKKDRFFASGKKFLECVLCGVVALGIPWACLFWGEQFVSPSVAAILNSSVPIFTALWAIFIFKKDRVTPKAMLGILVGFVGIFCVFFQPLQSVGFSSELKGLLAIVLMAVFYGLGSLLLKAVDSKVNAKWVMFAQGLGGSLITIPMSMALGESWSIPWSGAFAANASILYLAIFSTGLALVMFFKLIHSWGAVYATSVTYLVPIVSIALDAVISSRRLSAWQGAGMLIILLGLYIMQSQNRKAAKLAKAA